MLGVEIPSAKAQEGASTEFAKAPQHEGVFVPALGEIAFIVGASPDLQTLALGVRPGVEVVVLDPAKNGLTEMARRLRNRENLSAIHVISHGESAKLCLGSLTLTAENLQAYARDLKTIGRALNENGDLLIYGCDVGSTEYGFSFVARLAELTGADVASSTDATGAAARGGNWTLELLTGGIESSIALHARGREMFSSILFSGTVNFSSGSDLGPIAESGEGGSTTPGGTIVEFFIGDDAGVATGGNIHYGNAGDGFEGLSASANPDQNGFDALVIRTSGGGEFDFNGFTAADWGNAEGDVLTVEGFRDGVSTGAPVALGLTAFEVKTYTGADLPNSQFSAVDTVVIRGDWGAGKIYGQFDAFVFADAVIPNAAPSATNLTQSKAVTEGGGAVALDDIVITDADIGETVTATLTLSNSAAGTLSTGTYGSATSTYNAGTGVWTVTGSVADVNAALAAVALTPSANNDQNFTITTRIRDAADTGPANGTISATVTPVNDALTASNLTQSKAATEGGSTVALDDIVVTDADAGDTVTATLTLSNSAAGSLSTGTYGSATSTFNAGTGTWTVTGSVADVNAALAAVALTPSANNDQNFTITTRIRDAAATGPADGTISFTITGVNDGPVIDSGIELTLTAIAEDAGAPANGVPSGTLVSALVAGISDPDAGAAQGVAVIGADTTQGTWWFTPDGGTSWSALGSPSSSAARLLASDANTRLHFQPNANWSGTLPTALTVRAWDRTAGSNGGQANISVVGTGGTTPFSSGTDVVSLTVNAAADAPSASNLTQSKAATEGGSTVVLDDIVVTDGDSGDTITATLTLSAPGAGTLSTGTFGSASSTFNGGTGVWTVTGSVADVNAALAAVALTPSANNDQNFTITTRIRDAAVTGPADGTISITVTPANDAPTATNLTQSKPATEGGSAVALDDIVVSDVDSGEIITATLTLSSTTAGALSTGTYGSATSTFNAGTGVWTVTGSVSDVNAALAAVALTPSANNDQNFTITPRIRDAADTGPADGTITVTVAAVNDAPVITNLNGDVRAYTEDTSFVSTDTGAMAAIADVELDVLDNYSGASITVVRNGGANADDDFGFFAGSGVSLSAGNILKSGSSIATFVVTGGQLVITFTDANGQTPTTFNANYIVRNIGYRNTSDNPPASVTLNFTASDGALTSAVAAVTVNITATNDAPIGVDKTVTTNEDVAYTFAPADFGFSDVDTGDTLSGVRIDSIPLVGSLTLSGDAVTAAQTIATVNLGNLVFTPAANAHGAAYASFTFSVRDQSSAYDAVPNTVMINVTAVNDAPTGISLSPSSVNQSAGANAAVGSLSTTDVDDSSFTYALVSGTDSTHNALFNLSGADLRANDSITMPAGSFAIRVSTTDASSAVYEKSFTITVVDDVAPAAPTTPDLATVSDTGSSTSDDVTRDTTPSFAGTAEANSTVELFRNGSTSLGTTLANGSGVWSITVVTALTSGSHSITAKATDAASNTGASSGALSITIDDTGPSAPSTPNLVDASDTGTSDTDDVTNETTPTFSGTAEANSSVELFRDLTTSLGTASVDGNGAWTLTVGTALSAGTFSITAIATDAAGTQSDASNALNITIDATAPAIPVISAISEDLGTSATDFITNDTTLVFSGTAEADSFVTVFRNAVEVGIAMADTDGIWSFDFTGTTLAEGTHTFAATASDLAGNTSSASPDSLVEIVLETLAAPAIAGISNDFGVSNSDGITNDATLVLTGTAPANQLVTVARNGVGEIGTSVANGAGAWSFDYSATALADGTYLFTAIATDTAGNVSAVSADFPITVDTTAPVIATEPIGGTHVAGGSFNLSVSATDDGALTYQWYRGATALTEGANRSGSASTTLTHTVIDAAGFAGDYTVVVTDLAGNTVTSAIATIIVELSDQTITFPIIADRLTTNAPFSISATASTGFAVTFSVVSGPATISGSTVSLSGTAGTVIVRAEQSGNEYYSAAVPVDRSFVVTTPTEPSEETSAPVVTQQPSNQSVTAGSTATFSVSATGLPSPTYQWRRGGSVLSGQTGSSLTLSGLTQSDSGATFDVVVSNSAGAVTSNSAVLAVSPAPAQYFFGAIGADGKFALYVRSNGEAVLIVDLPTSNGSFVLQFTLNADGSFSAATPEVSPMVSALSSRSQGRSAALMSGWTINGSVVNGQLLAQVDTGELFNGTAQSSGSTAALAGFYEAPTVNGEGYTYLIVGPNGMVVSATIIGGVTEVSPGVVSPSGEFSVLMNETTVLAGALKSDGTVSAQVTTNGVVTANIAGVSADVTQTDRLINISTRGATGDNDKLIIAGFVISGSAPKDVLIRAVGPGLTGYGVTGAMQNPVLTLFRRNQIIGTNDDWGTSANPTVLATEATRLGASALAVGSKDAALRVTLDPGVYTAHITRAAGTAHGVALIEVYDASLDAGAETQKLVNISSRGEVGTGENILISGFVVTGNFPKKVLIRGVGPTLARQGVSGVLTNPVLRIWKGNTEIALNDDWSSDNAVAVDAAAMQVGAFPLDNPSQDAAILLTLAPGIYTAQVSGSSETTGIALVEVYGVP